MPQYTNAISQINSCLTKFNKTTPINENIFKGIFIKKMSNSNLIPENKYTVVATQKKAGQTHIDLPNKDVIDFFFDNAEHAYKTYEDITLDISRANLEWLKFLDTTEEYVKYNNRQTECIAYRRILNSSVSFSCHNHTFVSGHAYKKLIGHNGSQSQINRQRKRDAFYELLSHVYENDLLIFLKYSSIHYMLIVIPYEFSSPLQNILGQNANLVITNNSYTHTNALDNLTSLYKETIESEFNEIDNQMSYLDNLNGSEKEAIVKERVGQSFFRQQLLSRECKCAICNIKSASVLKASHIKRWADSTPQERMDIENGLLLCANHDALFDRHLISFKPQNGEIDISPDISILEYESLALSQSTKIKMSQRMLHYMEAHYNKYIEKQNKSSC